MTHQFDTEVAQFYGVDVAIIVNNLVFWITKNEANEKHFYDGKTWTYNTASAFQKLFPYWSESQIRRILKKMVDEDIIIVGDYSEDRWKRPNWYAFTDKFLDSFSYLFQNRQHDVTKSSARDNETVTSSISTDNKQSDTTRTSSKKFIKPSIEEIATYAKEIGSCLDARGFYDYYESNGWKVGRNAMKDWRATVRNWKRKEEPRGVPKEFEGIRL